MSGLPVMQTPVPSTFIQQPLQILNPASHQYSAAEVALLLEQQRLQLQQQQQIPLYMQPSTQNIQTSSYGYTIPTEQLGASMVSPSFPNIQQPLYNLYPNFSTPSNVLPSFIQRYGTAQNPIEMNALPNVQQEQTILPPSVETKSLETLELERQIKEIEDRMANESNIISDIQTTSTIDENNGGTAPSAVDNPQLLAPKETGWGAAQLLKIYFDCFKPTPSMSIVDMRPNKEFVRAYMEYFVYGGLQGTSLQNTKIFFHGAETAQDIERFGNHKGLINYEKISSK